MRFIRKKIKKAKTLPVKCGWRDCEYVCQTGLELNSHLSSHLEEYESSDYYECHWKNCDFTTNCCKDIERHVYYHGYYRGLLVQGKHEGDINKLLPKCAAPAREGEQIPELKDDFICEWTGCKRIFTSVVEFQDHIIQHASFEYEMERSPEIVAPKFQCKWSFCTKQLDNKYRLIEHIHTHTNKKLLACFQCGAVFRTKTTFFDHVRRQPENNTHKFQCAQCFKFFATEKLFRTHVVKHVNCFKCTFCDMTCPSASSLASHIRYRHLKDKPFQCQECDYRSVRKHDLLKHERFLHQKQVQRCNQPGCNYSVRAYSVLRRHYLEVHENTPFYYICHCCEKIFKYGHSLSVHLIKKHDFQLPSGHKRFKYRVDQSGFYRLETMRIESLEVTNQILSPATVEAVDATQDSSSFDIAYVDIEQQQGHIIASFEHDDAPHVGRVTIALPATISADLT